ncbi:MAG: DUF262 domain-containing protein [Spirochaetota bacterium]
MQSGLATLSELFDGAKRFIVPKYQRAYAWEEEQLTDFFDDLLFHSSDRKYFLGTILLKTGADSDDFEELELVDGQQRLTTTVMCVDQLLKHIKGDSKIKYEKYIKYHNTYKLHVLDVDNDFFQTYIIEERGQKNITTKTPSQSRLLFAQEYLKKRCSALKQEDLKRMLSILEKSEILVYSVEDSAEASLIFETTNDRGKSLTYLEKIKSHLMYKAYLAGGNKSIALIDNIYSRFGEIYSTIEALKVSFAKVHLSEVTEDQICQYHFITYHNWRSKREYQNFFDTLKNNLNEMLVAKKRERLLEYINEYTLSLKEFFNNLKSLVEYQSKPLKNIFFIGYVAAFYPIMTAAFRYANKSKSHEFEEFLTCLENFSFRVFTMKFKRTNDVDVFLNELAFDFKGDFKETMKKIRAKIKELSPKKAFVANLKSENLYNEIDLTYFFWKYENVLRTAYQPKVAEMPYEEITDPDERFKITIEHITAQTPKNGLKYSDTSEDFEEKYLHSLGNLTIDPRSSNASKGNEAWEAKSTYYFERAPFKTQLELSSFVHDKKWDEASIQNRAKTILAVMNDVWD